MASKRSFCALRPSTARTFLRLPPPPPAMFSLGESLLAFSFFGAGSSSVLAPVSQQKVLSEGRYFDVQAHRGGRGNTVENTMTAFAWALIHGSTTLELDNGVTKDGVVVVWHDERIQPNKCSDTRPAFANDPDFPYVGKYIVDLSWKQVQTLDCGSKRQSSYPMQLTSPGARIRSLEEIMSFVKCADPQIEILWNIESKIDALNPNRTRSVQDFAEKQHTVFAASPYHRSITYQSFDWRSLLAMKSLDPKMQTSALVDSATAATANGLASPWLAGLRLEDFPGPTFGHRIAQAASLIGAEILSPAALSEDTPADLSLPFIPFTTLNMVQESHRLGLKVKPWTVNRLDVAEFLGRLSVDGIITDYPDMLRRWIKERGLHAAPKYPKKRVFACLKQYSS